MSAFRFSRLRRLSPYVHWLVAIAGSVLGGCSDAQPPVDGARSTTSALELTEGPAPPCAAGDLVQHACAGPWLYHRWGTCTIRNQAQCGWELCRHPSFGWEVEPGQLCVLVCDPEPPQCDPHAPSCPRDTCWQECGPDPARPGVANLGRGEVCGAAACAYADPSCEPDPALSASPSGLTLEALQQQWQVAAQAGMQCTTCDQLPMDTPGSARQKFDCLQSRFSDPAVAGAGVHAAVGARVRVVSALAADQLTPVQRAVAREHFTLAERQTALTCEPAFSVDVPTECAPDAAASLERDLAYCARMATTANAAGRASVAWVTADECVALFERVNRAKDATSPEHACAGAEVSARTSEIARTIVGAAMAALGERQVLNDPAAAGANERYPELERTLVLMDRWYRAQRQSLALAGSPNLDAAASASLSDLTGAFWAEAHAARRTTEGLDGLFGGGTPSDGEVIAAIGLTAARANRLDRDVLRAVYSGLGASIPSVQSEMVEVLPALVVAESAARGDLLLKLSADAFTGLRRNLERVEPFHDLGCRLGGCGPRALTANLTNTTTSNLWRALAALDRDAVVASGHETLAVALARLDTDDPWRAVFQRISDNRAALRSAVDAATSESESVALERANVGTMGLAATGLAEMVRTAAERSLAYLGRGMFGIESERRIHANVSASGRQATIAAIEAAHDAFSRDIEHFQTERRDAVRDALALTDANRAVSAAKVRLAALDRALALLSSDAAGLSASLQTLDRGLGATADRMADIEGPLDTGSFIAVGDTRRFVVHGFNASRAENAEHASQPIELLAARDIELGQAGMAKISAQANQLVVVEASGEYSPLCALSRRDASHPEGVADVLERYLSPVYTPEAPPLSFAPTPGTTVGPEGFKLTSDSSRVEAHSADEDVKDNPLFSRMLGGLAAIPEVGAAVAQGVRGTLQSFDPIEDSSSSSQSDSVRFQGGLRLPNTPFPNLPAGALLLVEVASGATHMIGLRALHIVERPATTFVTAADSDLYFVVNDVFTPDDAKCRALSPPNDPNAVTVSVRLATPTAEVAVRNIDALRRVIDEIRTTRATFLAQGRVLQSQLTQLAADATLHLQTLSGFDLAAVPPVLRDLIEAYLRREVSAIEIAVERQSLERRATDVMLEVEAMVRDLAALQASARSATLLPVWRLRTFDEFRSGSDERSLVESAQKLGASAAETVLPILELWHPDAIRNARAGSSFKLDVQALANIGPDGDPLPLVDEVARLLQNLRDAYASDPITHLPDPLNQPIVGVSFRRPAAWRPAGCPACPVSTSGLPSASAARSLAVWNAIEAALRKTQAVPPTACSSDADCAGQPGTRCKRDQPEGSCVRASTRVTFGIEAEDVYRRNGGQATLSCFLATPAVQQWGLYFANQADDFEEDLRQLSLTGRYLEPSARASQPFMIEGGLLDYKLTDPASLVSGMSLLYGSDETAYSNFQDLANQGLLLGRNPVGLSALSPLTVDFEPLATMSHSFGNGIGESRDRAVAEVVLFMRLDARQFATEPQGHELEGIVSACKPAPQGPNNSPPPPPPPADPAPSAANQARN